jgi:hypothetical protein
MSSCGRGLDEAASKPEICGEKEKKIPDVRKRVKSSE